jgi:hypothetical protein
MSCEQKSNYEEPLFLFSLTLQNSIPHECTQEWHRLLLLSLLTSKLQNNWGRFTDQTHI